MRRALAFLLLITSCGPPPRAQPAPAAAVPSSGSEVALGKRFIIRWPRPPRLATPQDIDTSDGGEGRFALAGCEIEWYGVGTEKPLGPTLMVRDSYRTRVAPLGGLTARWARWRGVQYEAKAPPLFYLGVFVPAERLLIAVYCRDDASVDQVAGVLETARFAIAPAAELPAAELPRGPAAFSPVPRTCTWQVSPDSAGARAGFIIAAENPERWLRRAAIDLVRTDVPGSPSQRHDPDDRPWALAVEPGHYAILVTTDHAATLCEPIEIAAGQIIDVRAVLDIP